MKRKDFFGVLSVFVIGLLLFSVTTLMAQEMKRQGNSDGYCYQYQYTDIQSDGGQLHRQSGMAGPQWFINPDEFSGQGPSWMLNPQEGVGPWFWQAYNGYDVSSIAPSWYIDPTTAYPTWYTDGINAPWWSSYIMDFE